MASPRLRPLLSRPTTQDSAHAMASASVTVLPTRFSMNLVANCSLLRKDG